MGVPAASSKRTAVLLVFLLGLVFTPSDAQTGWLLLTLPIDWEKLGKAGNFEFPPSAYLKAGAGEFLEKNAPLNRWEQLGAFDSALECETARSVLQAGKSSPGRRCVSSQETQAYVFVE